MSLARKLAEFVVSTPAETIPDTGRRYAWRAILDTVAVAIAAREEPAFQISREAAETLGISSGAQLWPTGERVSVAEAAFLNGTASHCLDYDDMVESIHGHPSVSLVPALLAVGEQQGASGRAILDAYVIGLEVQAAIGSGMELLRHFKHGWHSTSSIGGIGAAAAVVRLCGGSVEAAENALGLAVSLAGGSRENFGTMTKPVHAGLAAAAGVRAGILALGGLNASPKSIDGPQGYFTMFYGDGANIDAVVETVTNHWAFERDGVSIKKHPCCFNTVRSADAALIMCAKGLDPHQIEAINITIEPGGTAPLIYSRPVTGLQGKFSAELVVASALLDGKLEFETFTDPMVLRPQVQALVNKCTVSESATPPFGPAEWEEGYSVVDVELTDGSHVIERIGDPVGHWRNPMSDEEVTLKVADCIRFSGTGFDASALAAEVAAFENVERFTGLSSLVKVG